MPPRKLPPAGYMTMNQAADYLNATRQSLYRWVHKEKVHHIWTENPRQVFVLRSDIERIAPTFRRVGPRLGKRIQVAAVLPQWEFDRLNDMARDLEASRSEIIRVAVEMLARSEGYGRPPYPDEEDGTTEGSVT